MLVAVVFLLQELAVIRIRPRVVESMLAVACIRQQIDECLATISADEEEEEEEGEEECLF